MRFSKMFIPTVKETPADAQVTSHRLMVRAGMIRKLAAGIYTYLPLAQRVLNKISNIVREEMDNAGAQELLMPAVQPKELWEDSGRWQKYGPELLRFHDRKGGEFCIGPTHEEVITTLVKDDVRSYKQLPLNLYQIQTKFRDEVRPRFGLMRGREFIMKDGYSFDIDDDAASASYDAMYAAYSRIFERCGLRFRPVEADTGAIGGNRSHEFQVLAETGEDAIVHCDACGYAANVELAAIQPGEVPAEDKDAPEAKVVSTPGKKTIDDVAQFLGVPHARVVKAVLFLLDEDTDSERAAVAFCRGDHDVNEAKLRRASGAQSARLLTDDEVTAKTGAPAGYVGPRGLNADVVVFADHALAGQSGLVAGAGEADAHLVEVKIGRDLVAETFYDLRTAAPGDPCGRCGAPFIGARGIEVGHVFSLGTKYSDAMGATVLDQNGKARPLVMGCYGIGVSRIAAAAIEQNHDDNGIVWPIPLAPFHVAVLQLGNEDEPKEIAEALYVKLKAAGIEVLLDDRKERPGIKFKDHDLIGIPIRVAIGARGLKDGVVEVKPRRGGKDDVVKVPVDDVADYVITQVKAEFAKAGMSA